MAAPKEYRYLRTVVQVIVIVVLGIACWLGWSYRADLPVIGPYFAESGPAQRRGGGEVLVDALPVTRQRITDVVRAVGTTRANEAVTVTSEVAGRIAEIRFREGDVVRRDAVLVRLDAAEILADLDGARAELNRAQQNYDRGVKLREARAVTQARTEELAQELASAQAAVAQIAARLDNYELRAPFGGRLGLRQISRGALIRPGDAIVTLDDISVLKIDFDIPETALSGIHPGQTVNATSAAWPRTPIQGVVATVDTRIDPVTRAVTIRAEIPNEEGLLRPGMFLNVELVYGETPDALTVPEEAIIAVDDGMFVFAVTDGKAERRPVLLGRRRPGMVEVLEGLNAGEQVIVGGVQKVRQGAPVKVRNPKDGGAAAS